MHYMPFDPRVAASLPSYGAGARVGWTAPTIIYDKMRSIDRAVAGLDSDYRRYVTDAPTLAAWNAWKLQWDAFFAKYQTDSAKLGAAFYTDELNAQTEGYRRDLGSFYDTFQRQRQANGQPVPPPSVPFPVAPPPDANRDPNAPPRSSTSWSLPWWFWVAATIGTGLAGYLAYKKYLELTAKRKALETYVLPGLIGPDLAKAAAAHDPSRPPSLYAPHSEYGRALASYGQRDVPRSLAEYDVPARRDVWTDEDEYGGFER